jgi:hypothetical protein
LEIERHAPAYPPGETDVPAASGASISSITGSPTNTQVGGDEVYSWSSNGSFVADGDFTVRVLRVDGGASGGTGLSAAGSGGGGGGHVIDTTFSVVSGQTYTVTVGAEAVAPATEARGTSGNPSGLVGTNAPGLGGSAGGGGIDDEANGNGVDGSNGGGAAGASGGTGGIGSLGNNGGNNVGGSGEGAGGGSTAGAGSNNTGNPTYLPGDGGPATFSDITGTSLGYGAGGDGGLFNSFVTPANGVNPGDGGEGGGNTSTTGGTGAAGIVIIRFTP